MMTLVDLIAIDVETPMIDSRCFLEKEFTKLIRINSQMILYIIVNQAYSCHGYVCGPLIWDTKDIL